MNESITGTVYFKEQKWQCPFCKKEYVFTWEIVQFQIDDIKVCMNCIKKAFLWALAQMQKEEAK